MVVCANGRAASAAERGYSLLELVVTVMILGITLIAVLPNFKRITGKSRVIDATRQAESAFQYARMKAINERKDYVVQFSGTGYNVFADDNSNGVRDSGEGYAYVGEVRLPAKSVRYQFPLNGSPATGSEGVVTNSCKCTRFEPDGTIRTAANTTLNQVLSIGDGTDYRQITVSVAGAVKVQKWNGSAWE